MFSRALIGLSDELYIKTKMLFDDADLELLNISHAYAVNQYIASRSNEELNYTAETGNVTGIKKIFVENSAFLPLTIAGLIENPINGDGKPVIENSLSKQTQYALASYAITKTQQNLRRYETHITLNDLMAYSQAETNQDKVNRMEASMQKESHRMVMYSRLNNLTYGIETLLHITPDDRKYNTFANQMANLADVFTTLCETANSEKLSPDHVEQLLVHRHLHRRQDLSNKLDMR